MVGKTAAVIGAGIGGLAAGVALRKAGWSVTVFEHADEIRPLGAGLSVWPNGSRALRSLGLGPLVDQAPRTGGSLRRADGGVLAEFDPDVIEQRYGAPLVGLHRADLHEALLDALGSEHVRLGVEFIALGDDDSSARFADGSSAQADLILGADGLGSRVRTAIVGDGKPADSGIVAFRGVSPITSEVPAGEWWGSGSAAGLLPLLEERVYWYLAFRGDPDPLELERRVAEYGAPVREVIGATVADEILVHRLYDRPATSSWSRGSVTLIGDAAHPMLPFLGQGACSALVDAVALGEALAVAETVPAALAAYENARIRRTADLVKGSRQAARVALAGSAVARSVRHALVGWAPASMRLRQLDRVIGKNR